MKSKSFLQQANLGRMIASSRLAELFLLKMNEIAWVGDFGIVLYYKKTCRERDSLGASRAITCRAMTSFSDCSCLIYFTTLKFL